MDTTATTAEKAEEQRLALEIDLVSKNPIMSALLRTVGGMLAVINEHRQVIAYNDSFLEAMGIDNPRQYIGLRPGQVLRCVHADDGPSGCGSAKPCETCGAAIAMVASLSQEKPVERICALTAKRNGEQVDIALMVRSHPIQLESKLFLLLFLQDITQQQQQAALARTFFHDVNNMLCMLVGASQLLFEDNPTELGRAVLRTSVRLQREVVIQRCLTEEESYNYAPLWQDTGTEEIAAELTSFFANHPSAHGRHLIITNDFRNIFINTDLALLMRVLCNMIINAFEATEENGMVRLWLENATNTLTFCVWNNQEIPRATTDRIFQRNYSTKDQKGRGVGTYSMKLFGEKILGGKVNFTTSAAEGTVFRLTLPLRNPGS